MYDWRDFASVFHQDSNYSPDHKQTESIARHRKELGGTLFFDRVWASLGLKQPTKFYPPKSNQDLRNLWHKVVQSSAPDHQKQALLFYILKDCKEIRNADSIFSRKVFLPHKYQLLVTGLWLLDHCQFLHALEHLTDPSLTPTFTDEILLVLLQHPKCDDTLAVGYYQTVSPPLKNPETLEAYFSLLCKTNVVQAYYFSVKQDHRHQEFFEKLLVEVFSDAPSEQRAQRAFTLISLAFSADEQNWFEECLLHGRGSKFPQAKDAVIARRLGMGKSISGVGALDRYKGATIDGVNWDEVRASFGKAVNGG